MADLQINFNIDDRFQDIKQFLRVILPWVSGPREGADRVNLTECEYLGPYAASALVGVWRSMMDAGHPFNVQLPTRPPRLDAFCHFSGLKHILENAPLPNTDNPRNETVPLQYATVARADTGTSMINLLRRHINLSEESEEYLRLCLQEIVQNVADHAESPFGGVWCARFIEARQEVRVACVDGGIGIARALSKRIEVGSSFASLRMVFDGGHSSRSRENNMGLGISNLQSWVHNLGGNLILISGDAAGMRQPHAPTPYFEELPFFFSGTGVFFSVPITEEVEQPHEER